MSVEIFEKGGRAPEKHSGVPVIVPGTGVHLCDGQRRFFGEAAHCIDRKTLGVEGFAHALDVAETGFRARWGYAEDDHAAFAASDFEGGGHNDVIALWIGRVNSG